MLGESSTLHGRLNHDRTERLSIRSRIRFEAQGGFAFRLAGFTDTILAVWKFDRTTHALPAKRSLVQLTVKQDESDQCKYHQNAR